MDNKRIPVKSYSKNLVKTLGRILIFLFLPFVSFRFEEITGTRKTSVRILIRNFIFLRVLFSQ